MDTTFIQSTNKGDNIICLHSSMSSARQWDGLMQRLQYTYRVTALDLHGYGKAPQWETGTVFSLDREVELMANLVSELDGPIHLVGHSYGGAVAIKAAQTYGKRISSLTLYEPVIFAALFSADSDRAASDEIILLIEDLQYHFRCGDLFQAAQRFIDYWSGTGTWASIPVEAKSGLSKKMPTVLGNFEAILSEPNALADLASIEIPTLCLSGQESPRSVNAITDLLKRQLPQATARRFPGMGHMGPITHSEIVNGHIEEFIQRQSVTDQYDDYRYVA
jgi:pimeloyl-ACP methyl ester carboxylesterase